MDRGKNVKSNFYCYSLYSINDFYADCGSVQLEINHIPFIESQGM